MSTTTDGQVQSGLGKLESAAGDAVGDRDLQAKGGANQIEGKAKEAVGSAKEALGQAADKAADAIGGAKQTIGAAAEKAQDARARMNAFVQDRPHAALLSAFALGFIASRLLAPGGPKVVYVKPRD